MSVSDDESQHTDATNSQETDAETDNTTHITQGDANGPEVTSELTNETTENRTLHEHNKTGSMIIKRRELSLGGNGDFLETMQKKWSSHELLNEKDKGKIIDDLKAKENEQDGVNGLIPLSAAEEVELVEKERDILEASWNKYIDLSGDGDVDLKEWLAGAGRAKIELTDMELMSVFRYLDKDKSGFIDKNDFCEFMQIHYESAEIKKVQKAVLSAFGSKYLHQRRQSNLFHNNDGQNWESYDLKYLEKEMQAQMTDMVTTMKKEVDKEQAFVAQIEQKHAENPDSFLPENAREWTDLQVVAWLESLELEPQYSKYFAQEKIDGAMLLDDIDETQLITHLYIKPIHAKKIMREIDSIRRAIRTAKVGNVYEIDELVVNIHKEDHDKMGEFLMKEMQADKLEEAMNDMKIEYEKKIEELVNENESLKLKIKEYETKGVRGSNEDDYDDEPLIMPSMDKPISDTAIKKHEKNQVYHCQQPQLVVKKCNDL